MIALLLAGHGSHISPQTAGLVWSYVDRLRETGAADEITACFWKEPPSFRQALDMVCSDTVIVVPVLAANGYFARTVIPAEMGLDGPLTTRDGRHIHYTRPLGLHPRLGDVLYARVKAAMHEYGLDPGELAVAVIGHGTRREPRSREAARQQSRSLAARLPGIAVLDAFLDDEPSIASIYERTDRPAILAIPWFLAPGSHVSSDVPRELGLACGATGGICHGRSVYYLGTPGTSDQICDLILDLARECEATVGTGKTGSVWSAFPRRGARLPGEQLRRQGEVTFGELRLTETTIRPDGGDCDGEIVSSPAQLRRLVREGPFRPLPEARGLPAGWRVEVKTPEQLAAVVETVYPGALADRAALQRGEVQTESLAKLARRQTGVFRNADQLPGATVKRVIEELCNNCVRQPVWHGVSNSSDELPCRRPCNLWLSRAMSEPV